MKKRIIATLLVLSFNFSCCAFATDYMDKQIESSKKNAKYASVKKYTWQEKKKKKKIQTENFDIKDPKLITFKNIKPIENNKYEKKIKQDEEKYKKVVLPKIKRKSSSINVNPSPVDFYNLYRIAEKIIRANNLDYVNWRIEVRKNTTDFNAETTAANLISINTALYDSLFTNPDALAFVISHELAHQILGHAQQIKDIQHKNKITNYFLLPMVFVGFHPNLITYPIELRETRKMEFFADALSVELITRAGFDMQKGMEAINIINALPHKETLADTHPIPEKRIENIEQTQKYLAPYLKEEGKTNIYNSEVLSCKKSSDRVSIVISQSKKKKENDYYEPESPQDMIMRIAYVNYKNADMRKAIKNFRQLSEVSDSYIPYLYTSYAFEYLYKQEQKPKYLKRAIKYANIALEITPDNKHVKKQIEDLKEDL